MTTTKTCPECEARHEVEDFGLSILEVMCPPCSAKEKATREKLAAQAHKNFIERAAASHLGFASWEVRQDLAELFPGALRDDLSKKIKTAIIDENTWLVCLKGLPGRGKTLKVTGCLRDLIRSRYDKPGTLTQFDNAEGLDLVGVSALELLGDIQSNYSESNKTQFLHGLKVETCKILVIDDLGREKASNDGKDVLAGILWKRHKNGLKTIVTTNEANIAKRYDEAIGSRFEGRRTLTITIEGQDYRKLTSEQREKLKAKA